MLTDDELREIEDRLAIDPLGDGGLTMTITNNETGEKSTSVRLSDAQRLLAEVKELKAENAQHMDLLQKILQVNIPDVAFFLTFDRETKQYRQTVLYETDQKVV